MKPSHVVLWGKSKDKMLNLHCNATATSYSATMMYLICVEREKEREQPKHLTTLYILIE